MAKGRKGKYEEWLTPDGLLLIEGWAREGLTEAQIAKNMGCALSTLKEWKKSYTAISDALKKGKAPVDLEVENALLKSAFGFEYEETVTELVEMPDGKQKKNVKKFKKLMPPNTTAQIFWLKNRRPDRWRDTKNIVSKSNGILEELINGLQEPENEDDIHKETTGTDEDVAKAPVEKN